LAWVKVRSMNERFDEVATNNVPSLELISRAQMAATQNRLLIYKQISSSDKADRQQLENQFAENGKIVTEALDQYDKLSVTAEERTIVAAIGTARGEYLKKCNEILEMNRNSADNTATYLQARSQLDPIASQYAAALQAASDHEIRSMGESSAEFQAAIASTKRGAALGVALAIMSGICISWSITRAIDRVLRRVSNSLAEGAGQVPSSSQQVSAASQTLAEGSSEQAASLEETGSSLEEMGSMTRRNSESATKATELARQTRQAADAGAQDMQAMKTAMGEIKDSSDDIAKIIKTIDEIAFQTNILALNAAVEAARAGASGAGFAVVADEVRALAQRSAQAARETAEKIDGARAKSVQGVEMSEKVARSLFEIVDKVRQVDQLITEVSTASHEQSQGVGQIASAVSQMDKVVQASASNAEETAAAAEELNAQAGMMRDNVAELLALVDGGSDLAPAAPVQPEKYQEPVLAPRRSGQSKRPSANLPRSTIRRVPGRVLAPVNDAKLTFKDF
jgi:methyl-accepting chemotaxis protein